ncbi:Transcription-repair-coupling factor [Rickettsiales bacterium Ac37b]|nr:Transcription-repair-coupling factor [Rickettsiales bacterium Ac37b]
MFQKNLFIQNNQQLICCPVASNASNCVLAAISIDNPTKNILYIVNDEVELSSIVKELNFFIAGTKIITLPGWDSLPYDRVSPSKIVSNSRIQALYSIVAAENRVILVTTLNSMIQYTVPPEMLIDMSFSIRQGLELKRDDFIDRLLEYGFLKVSITSEAGEFSVRGSIIDICLPNEEQGIRLDFFGNTIESIKVFDLITQKSDKILKEITILPVSEVILNSTSIKNFTQNYLKLFGINKSDLLYEATLTGQRYIGVEHWLPLFYKDVATIFDYLKFDIVIHDSNFWTAYEERKNLIHEYYTARLESIKNVMKDMIYNAVPPELVWINKTELESKLLSKSVVILDQFLHTDSKNVFTLFINKLPNFLLQARVEEKPIYDILHSYIKAIQLSNKKLIICCTTEGSRQRISHILQSNNITICNIELWSQVQKLDVNIVGITVYPLSQGFELEKYVLISEQDLLGERIRPRRNSRKRLENIINETVSFAVDELVVHRDYGIGRFIGLETVDVLGIKHDFLSLVYEGGDKLYIPVENIELLSRYGSDNEASVLDKLGGTSWQIRKSRLQNRIKLAAEELLKTAAERELKTVDSFNITSGMYDEFCAKFPYPETDDQLSAIREIEEDLSLGKPMDRLVCGDVGFGKTEVALRAAFIVALAENIVKPQVAVIVPSTLLARQHYLTFKERFAGFPIKIALLSRMVPEKEITLVKHDLAEGNINIIIGTHAILNKNIEFKNLQLIIIDEEHHFGVAQKERLKQLRADVHILTLSATPIPRTLQMSLVGIKKLSLIATPPIDRIAVRTFIMPFDSVVIKEAILREYNRGGKIFYVCPKIADLTEIHNILKDLVPEIRMVVAHGQMPASRLDDIMNAFCNNEYDLLLSTSIVESGLDIASANTIIVHRADIFGLAQLYQLRGRVGRGKIRAYAYLTLPPKKILSKIALARLEVMQTLDSLGAGFSLASYDMDLRGFGNLVGEEQSGHIKEVGVELYQDMLKEAVEALIQDKNITKSELDKNESGSNTFVPQMNLGLSVLIPESYIPDLSLRLGIYKRASTLENEQEIEEFALGLIDRFGDLPNEVEHLLTILKLKQLCYKFNIEKIDSGPQAVVIAFKDNICHNPEELLNYIRKNQIKLRADQKLLLPIKINDAEERLKQLIIKLKELSSIITI